MIVSPVEITLGYPTGRAPRTEGIHISRIIRSLAHRKGLLDGWVISDLGLVEMAGKSDEWWESLDMGSRLRICIGLAWEEWYIPQLDDVSDHPGEMCLDGIYMTHDGESLDLVLAPEHGQPDLIPNYKLAIHEIKATYKSTKTVGEFRGQWMWEAQTKAYCKGLGTTTAYVHVLFLCGNYWKPITPQLKCWRIDYTQEEIDANWEEMVGHVRLQRTIEQS